MLGFILLLVLVFLTLEVRVADAPEEEVPVVLEVPSDVSCSEGSFMGDFFRRRCRLRLLLLLSVSCRFEEPVHEPSRISFSVSL